MSEDVSDVPARPRAAMPNGWDDPRACRLLSQVTNTAVAKDVPGCVAAIRELGYYDLPRPIQVKHGGHPWHDLAPVIHDLWHEVQMLDRAERGPTTIGAKRYEESHGDYERQLDIKYGRERVSRAVEDVRQVVVITGAMRLVHLIECWQLWHRDWPDPGLQEDVEKRALGILQGRGLAKKTAEALAQRAEKMKEEERDQKRYIRENPGAWGVKFMTMFSMSEDSHLFKTSEELEAEGYRLDGNIYRAPPPPAEGEGGAQ